MPETFRGSCLCGGVKYAVEGEANRFFNCHCSRCRKASGTGHASNILLDNATIKWRGDDTLRKSFKVPEAARFTNHFCARCGSPVPRDYPERNLVIIPAGSLDHEIEVKPQARIFADSKTSWSCTDSQIPVFATYPT